MNRYEVSFVEYKVRNYFENHRAYYKLKLGNFDVVDVVNVLVPF